MRLIKTYSLLFFLIIGAAGCKKWEDHTEVTNQDLTQNLAEAISSNANLSRFRELVTQAGLDSALKSSKTYTVWAPTNAALQTLDPAIVADPVKLKSFLMNHIASQTYFVRDAGAGIRVAMLNGKYNSFTGNRFDDATLTSADKYVSNGVLHVIDKSVAVLPSIWEYVNATTTYAQNNYLTTLNYNAFDPSLAIVDSINSLTGQPIYKPGTGIVVRNTFNDRLFDVRREDRQYTYFVVANSGFTAEADSLKNYYKASTTAITDSLTRWSVVKDLVVEGVLTTLPTSIVSKSGIVVPLNAADVIETRRVSNGIVYVMSKIDVPTASKFREIFVQGENPSGFLIDRTGNTSYRAKLNPVTGAVFNDIMISGHGVTTYYAFYRLNETPSIKYRVYALGVNDFQAAAFSQTIVTKYLAGGVYTTLSSLNHAVPLSTAAGAYNEILLGEFTSTAYGTLEIQLTSTATNPLVLDYLRLVPVP